MRVRARVGSVLAAAAIACGALLAGAPPAAAQHHIVRTAQLDRDGEFRIWNLQGSVRVVGWDLDSVRVEGDFDDVARAGFLFGAQGAGGKMSTESYGRSGHADLLVRVPRGATVWVKTLSAPVVVTGVEGVIDVYAVTGDVHIETSARSVYAESMGGRVRVVGSYRVVRLRSGSGALEFDGAADDLSLTSVSGDIRARAAGLTRGIIESVGGDVRLGVSLRARAALEILTHDGDVDVTLPRSVSADFMLRTVSGRLRSELRAATGEAERELLFSTGRGGSDVEIRTFSGAIVVRPGSP